MVVWLVGRRDARQGQLEWCLSACIKPGRRDLSLFSFIKGVRNSLLFLLCMCVTFGGVEVEHKFRI